jgi:hypothetical protein
MEHRGTKEAAEAVLRELPSVVGAFVREDAHGYPREVHLLIAPGPKPRHFALDVRSLLEERLGIPIDQRIISIAQLASSADTEPAPVADILPLSNAATPMAARPAESRAPHALPRVRFVAAVSEADGGRVTVTVRLGWEEAEHEGAAVDVDSPGGRARAGALALLRAANHVTREQGTFELDSASLVRVLERDYVIVSTFATSRFLGRRPVSLAGAQPAEEDGPATAGALAALKSVNRLLGWIALQGSPGIRARQPLRG